MANEFVIKKGHSSKLGLIAQEDLVENGWYLTTDTAEVYVALRQENDLLALKKINDCDVSNDFPSIASFEERLEALEADHAHTYGYKKDFPTEGKVNHLYIAADTKRTYVFTNGAYIPIADQFDYTDHDNKADTPEVRIIFGGTAEQ